MALACSAAPGHGSSSGGGSSRVPPAGGADAVKNELRSFLYLSVGEDVDEEEVEGPSP